jgi:hypothetical protein
MRKRKRMWIISWLFRLVTSQFHHTRAGTTSLAIAIILVALSKCSRPEFRKDTRLVSIAVDRFHQLIDLEQDEQIYVESTDHFRSTFNRQTARDLFSQIRALGACDSPELRGLRDTRTKQGTSVRVAYATKCYNGLLFEKFLWKIEHNVAKLDEFTANSPAFARQ